MAEAHVHSLVLEQAARKVLRPLGLVQKGRSRTWVGDNGWWMEVVEFQPSSWSKGSYLNVGCLWLWNVKPYISFDEGSRFVEFQKFESEQQFKVVAEMLARTAAERILHFRAQFPTICAVSDHYRKNPPVHSLWPTFNAAIAHGLCGRTDAALTLLGRIPGTLDHSIEWQKNADQDARYIASEIHDVQRFRRLVSERVVRARELHKLPQRQIEFSP